MNLSGTDILVDHCSASWAVDENIGAVGRTHSRNIITISIASTPSACTTPISITGKTKTFPANMGSLLKPFKGDGAMSVHHNLYVSNNNRNPAVGTYHADQSLNVDIRNNVIYNCHQNGYSSGDSRRVNMDYVGNYVIAGPATGKTTLQVGVLLLMPRTMSSSTRLATGSTATATESATASIPGGSRRPIHQVPRAVDWVHRGYPNRRGGVPSRLAEAGAMPWNRDAVDTRSSRGSSRKPGRSSTPRPRSAVTRKSRWCIAPKISTPMATACPMRGNNHTAGIPTSLTTTGTSTATAIPTWRSTFARSPERKRPAERRRHSTQRN